MHPFLNTANTAARDAGKILLRGFDKLGHVHVEEKGRAAFTSEISQGIHNYITDVIKAAYPGHTVLKEGESFCFDKANAAPAQKKQQDQHQWLIDPIAGVNNFARRIPEFALSITLQINGKIEQGLIYDPIREEVFTAMRGKGAHVNNTRMRVTKETRLNQALLATGFALSEDRSTAPLELFNTLFSNCQNILFSGCTPLSLAYVAAGRIDAFFQSQLSQEDFSAGTLMIREAGGLISDFHGSENYYATGDVIAGNPKIYKALAQTIIPICKR